MPKEVQTKYDMAAIANAVRKDNNTPDAHIRVLGTIDGSGTITQLIMLVTDTPPEQTDPPTDPQSTIEADIPADGQ